MTHTFTASKPGAAQVHAPQLLTLFARKEKSCDPLDVGASRPRMDTVLYRDEACTDQAARWPWHYSNCPRRGQVRVIFNCWPWKLSWV